MRDKIRRLTENAPVDHIDIRFERRKTVSVGFAGHELDEIAERETIGGSVRACHRGGWGFCSFTLENQLEKAVAEACGQASAVGRGATELVKTPAVSGFFRQGEGQPPSSVSLEEKKELVRGYNGIILGMPRVVSSRVNYLDRRQEMLFASSNGSLIEQERVFTGLTFSATARDGVNVQRAYHSVGDHRGYGNVKGLEPMVQVVGKRASDLLDARKVEGGRTTVILDPKLTGVFAHEAFGHMSEADFISENPAIAAKMKQGACFGPQFLNIVDDGTLLSECGGYPYDDEGVQSSKTYLVRNGCLAGHLHSLETAARMNAEPTGNARALSSRFKPIVRMSCTYIEPGTASFEEMVSGVRNGVYAVGMLGGNTDLEQFTFSAEYGFTIKDGKVAGLLRDVILTGNLFETLHNIDMAGNDLALFGGMGGCGKEGQSPLPVSDGGPHLRVKNLLIG